MIRKTVWAGPRNFYPDKPEILKKTIEGFIDTAQKKEECKAVLMPHAGYFYSGIVAGKTISCVNIPDTIIILAPNHTGLGSPYSILSKGSWETPFGNISIQEELAAILLENSEFFRQDEAPHIKEHAIEVEVPFLQYFNKNISIVPVIISDFGLNNYRRAGGEIASAVKKFAKPVLIVISSDMTHYESHESAKEKDQYVIEAIKELDVEKLYKRVHANKISMCGCAPACVGISAVKKLGAQEARLIDYQTSGDTSGDFSSVVGYAGLIIK
ncbi:MAG: AmmeMemoRadiSam system protein B [Candidatus Omnitrophica bacterium]|nr:AmmeMemoRadiSam system protein B [Candidatus Omnitrophota bacterium]